MKSYCEVHFVCMHAVHVTALVCCYVGMLNDTANPTLIELETVTLPKDVELVTLVCSDGYSIEVRAVRVLVQLALSRCALFRALLIFSFLLG